MTNDYLQFSGILTNLTADEERWLRHALRDPKAEVLDDEGIAHPEKLYALLNAEPWRDSDCGPDAYSYDFSVEFGDDPGDDGSYLRIYSEEGGSTWAAGELVRAFLKLHRPRATWSVTWATSSDRPNPGAYNGGAIVVTADEIRSFAADTWAAKQIEDIEARRPVAREPGEGSTEFGRFSNMDAADILDDMDWTDDELKALMRDFVDGHEMSAAYRDFLALRARLEEDAAGTTPDRC